MPIADRSVSLAVGLRVQLLRRVEMLFDELVGQDELIGLIWLRFMLALSFEMLPLGTARSLTSILGVLIKSPSQQLKERFQIEIFELKSQLQTLS